VKILCHYIEYRISIKVFMVWFLRYSLLYYSVIFSRNLVKEILIFYVFFKPIILENFKLNFSGFVEKKSIEPKLFVPFIRKYLRKNCANLKNKCHILHKIYFYELFYFKEKILIV
jgi:hypothetical protein